MRARRPVVALASLLALAGCATSTTERLRLPPLRTVDRVELDRYAGTWFEIASFPQRFQRGCNATTATYTARPDGDLDVVNRCRGHPNREYLWILSRTPTLADATYQGILDRLQAQGYETARLVRTLQRLAP